MQARRYGVVTGIAAAVIALSAIGAQAQVATEVTTMGDFTITLHLHDFLTADDLTVLRLVAKDQNALAMFVPEQGGFAALAASPDDGFTKDGAPVASASALGGLADAAAAVSAAMTACQVATTAKAACVILLEVAPVQ